MLRIRENVYGTFSQMERAGEGLKQSWDFMTGPDPGCTRLGLGMNAVNLVVSLLTGRSTLRRNSGHLTLISVAEEARCRKCGLEEESSFHTSCECNALAGERQRVLGQGYQDAVNIEEAFLLFVKV